MSQPEIVFRHGQCTVSIFENEYERGDEKYTVRSCVFQRRYLDRDGNWQSTSNLRVNDIPKAILVLNKAFEFLTSGSHQGCCEDDEEMEAQ